MPDLPEKLKKDAIVEALCEVRFECDESASLPEIVVGKLAEFELWRDFEKKRLPVSDIPAPIRSSNPSLKNEPILQLNEANGARAIKIGANVFSFHRLAPYPGWEAFKPEIDQSLDYLFGSFKDFKATRLGFRYLNAFTYEDHEVANPRSLNYTVTVAGTELTEPQNLNYRRQPSEKHTVQVRIASPEFVSGAKKLHVLVDLDVHTPDGVETVDVGVARNWIEDAHTYEKEEFFALFTDEMMQKLAEEG